jgi:hypothetical protein
LHWYFLKRNNISLTSVRQLKFMCTSNSLTRGKFHPIAPFIVRHQCNFSFQVIWYIADANAYYNTKLLTVFTLRHRMLLQLLTQTRNWKSLQTIHQI